MPARFLRAHLEFNADYLEVVTDQEPGKVLADFPTERAHQVGGR